jgi:hypothetical protein
MESVTRPRFPPCTIVRTTTLRWPLRKRKTAYGNSLLPPDLVVPNTSAEAELY